MAFRYFEAPGTFVWSQEHRPLFQQGDRVMWVPTGSADSQSRDDGR